MFLKDYITALQQIYNSYTPEYIKVAGEPEIAIERYEKRLNNLYEFRGITPDIKIRKSFEGVFLVLTGISEKRKKPKRVTKK